FSVRFAERIEVVYGSGTVLYGQDAISMIINIVTKKPGEGPSAGESPAAAGADQLATGSGSGSLPGSTKLTAQVGADGGVHLQRDTWGWFGGVLDPEHQVTYTGYVQYHDSNLTPINKAYPAYWADYITRENAPNRFNSNGVVPHLDDYGINFFGRVEGYNSSIQYWHREAQRNSAEGFSPALAFVPEAIWRDESDVLEGTNTLHLTKNVSLESRLTYNRYEVDPVSRYVEPDPTNPNAWFLNDYKYAIGWQGREEETLRIDLPDRITLLTGVVVSYSDVIPKSTVPGGFNPAGLSPVEQGGTLEYLDSLGMPHLIPRVTETKYWDYSPYVEAQWQLLDRLRLIGGTRITWDDRFQVVPITPRAAVVYNLTDQITAKYVYTEGFVAPAPYFANAVYDRLDILAQPNPSVGPESSKEHDVILTYARNNFSLTLNPYYGTQSGIVIVSDQDTPLNIVDMPPSIVNGMVTVPPGSLSGPPGPRTLVQTVNGGTSKRYGADIYGKGNFGSFSPWFSYSYVDYRQITAGVTTGLPGISRHNGRLGVTWTATPRLFITPSLEIRSTPENVDPGLLGEELKTPYTINLFVLYKYSQNLELFLSLHNLTNHHYALGGITPLQSGGLPLAIPQETFNGVLGLQLRY
ncbi:MAG: TonB-dependent receptor, partial [Planctomycetes bacterium]|nr:TonB-dependent receptor [Planctomycetota bacterium]